MQRGGVQWAESKAKAGLGYGGLGHGGQARAGRLVNVNMARLLWRSVGQPSQTPRAMGLREVLQHALQRLLFSTKPLRDDQAPSKARNKSGASAMQLVAGCCRASYLCGVGTSDMTRGSLAGGRGRGTA